jgi:hypothetical protein
MGNQRLGFLGSQAEFRGVNETWETGKWLAVGRSLAPELSGWPSSHSIENSEEPIY